MERQLTKKEIIRNLRTEIEVLEERNRDFQEELHIHNDKIGVLNIEKQTLFKNLAEMEKKLNSTREHNEKLVDMVDSAKEQIKCLRNWEIKIPAPDNHLFDSLRYAASPIIKKPTVEQAITTIRDNGGKVKNTYVTYKGLKKTSIVEAIEILKEQDYCLHGVEYITSSLQDALKKGKQFHAEIYNHDPVNRPSHYTDGKIEVISYIRDKKLGFCLGNAVKYISRAGKKDPTKIVEDLKKAIWYINNHIESLNEGEDK